MTPPLLARARVLLAEGKVVGVPTDTVYGLATRRSATKGLFQLKGRPSEKAIPVLVASMADAERLAVFPPTARQLAHDHWPGPLTLVLATKPGGATEARQTVGLRMPNHPLTVELLTIGGPTRRHFCKPIGRHPGEIGPGGPGDVRRPSIALPAGSMSGRRRLHSDRSAA